VYVSCPGEDNSQPPPPPTPLPPQPLCMQQAEQLIVHHAEQLAMPKMLF